PSPACTSLGRRARTSLARRARRPRLLCDRDAAELRGSSRMRGLLGCRLRLHCRRLLPNAVLPRFRHQEQAEDKGYRRNSDRVDQGITETVRRLERRRGYEWDQPTAPTIANVIGDRD